MLTPEAKSSSFWRTSLGKFRLLRPLGQREAGGGFLEEDTEEVVTDPCSSGCTCCAPWTLLLSAATLLPTVCCRPWIQALSREGPGGAWAHTPHSHQGSQHPSLDDENIEVGYAIRFTDCIMEFFAKEKMTGGFPGGSVVKNLPANSGDGFDPWSGKNAHATEEPRSCSPTTEPVL